MPSPFPPAAPTRWVAQDQTPSRGWIGCGGTAVCRAPLSHADEITACETIGPTPHARRAAPRPACRPREPDPARVVADWARLGEPVPGRRAGVVAHRRPRPRRAPARAVCTRATSSPANAPHGCLSTRSRAPVTRRRACFPCCATGSMPSAPRTTPRERCGRVCTGRAQRAAWTSTGQPPRPRPTPGSAFCECSRCLIRTPGRCRPAPSAPSRCGWPSCDERVLRGQHVRQRFEERGAGAGSRLRP